MGGECKGNWLYRGTTRNGGGGGEVCNTNKRESAREVCKFEGKQEHIRNSYRASRNRSQQPISSLRAQLFRISSHISLTFYLFRLPSLCVCISTIPHKYHLSRVCIYIYSSNIQKCFMRKYPPPMYPT